MPKKPETPQHLMKRLEKIREQRDELLAALKDCTNRLHWLNNSESTETPWIRAAEAAIAKCEAAK